MGASLRIAIMAPSLVLIALLGRFRVDAVTLRSSDLVDRIVNASAAIQHSAVLGNLLDSLDDVDRIPLTAVANAELDTIVTFINTIAVHEIEPARQFVHDVFEAAGLQAQCRLMIAANYLDMRCLMNAIASTKRSWGDITAMRDNLPTDAFWYVVSNAPGIVRLGQVADTTARKSIVRQIQHRLLIAGGNATVLNGVFWHHLETLLSWAACNNEEQIVELLVDGPGIDVNVRDFLQSTPLHIAAPAGHLGIVILLLRFPGVDVNLRDLATMTPLHWAVFHRRRAVVALLAHAPGIDVNAYTDVLMTPLHYAVSARYGDIIELLLGAPGIDVNARSGLLTTALHLVAVSSTYAQIAELLLRVPGIDVNARDCLRQTPLHIAASSGHLAMVKSLLSAPEIDLLALDNLNRTAFDIATAKAHHAIALLLHAHVDADGGM